MTEIEIERRVEARMDTLDRRLMRGGLSQAEYDAEVRALDNWAHQELHRDLRGGGGDEHQ